MITFHKDNMKFTYRIAGIALHDGCILLQKAVNRDIWFAPGGRAEFQEAATESLKREMREELDTNISVERLLWVVENFFEHLNVSHHELGLYFLIAFPHNSYLYDTSKTFTLEDANQQFIFQWHPIASIENLPLYPAFLQKALQSLPPTTEHIVHIG